MTAEQLEELLGKVTADTADGWWPETNYDGMPILDADQELISLAPSLARRVLAAEELLEATEAISREMAFILLHNPEKDGGLYRAALNSAVSASAAYREASK